MNLDIFKSPIVSLILSVLMAIAAALGEFYNSLILLALSLLILFIILHILIKNTASYVKNKKWMKSTPNIIIKNVIHEWRISTDASFHMKSTYTVLNDSNRIILTIPFDNIGWFTKPENIDISVELHEKDATNRFAKTVRYSLYDSIYSFFNKNIYMVSWSIIVDPPLKPADTLKYTVNVRTKETEKEAFTREGTFAGFPANYPIENAEFCLIAPEGYFFELLNSKILLNEAGDNVHEDSTTIDPVNISAGSGLAIWHLKNLTAGLRYIFKYRFIKGVS